jgi:hypothetical protein
MESQGSPTNPSLTGDQLSSCRRHKLGCVNPRAMLSRIRKTTLLRACDTRGRRLAEKLYMLRKLPWLHLGRRPSARHEVLQQLKESFACPQPQTCFTSRQRQQHICHASGSRRHHTWQSDAEWCTHIYMHVLCWRQQCRPSDPCKPIRANPH